MRDLEYNVISCPLLHRSNGRVTLCDTCFERGDHGFVLANLGVAARARGLCVGAKHPYETTDKLKLYLLKQLEKASWDEVRGIVISAASAEEARHPSSGVCRDGRLGDLAGRWEFVRGAGKGSSRCRDRGLQGWLAGAVRNRVGRASSGWRLKNTLEWALDSFIRGA